MATNWLSPTGVDTDLVFDPYLLGDKPGPTNFLANDGQDFRDRYAPIQFGATAPATYFLNPQGLDANQLFAARGTAAYLNSLGLTDYGTFCSGVTVTDTLVAQVYFIFRTNGTWEQWMLTTNFKTDSPGAYAPSAYWWINRGQTNFSNGRMIASGQWSQQVSNGIGAQYEVLCNAYNLVGGTADHYSTTNPSLTNYLIGNYKNLGTGGTTSVLQVNGTDQDLATNNTPYRLDVDRKFSLTIRAVGGTNNNRFFDTNSALSWFNRCQMDFTIRARSNTNQNITRSVQVTNEIRWNPWNWTGGGGSPPSGGGGGGCVQSDSYLGENLIAGKVTTGDVLSGAVNLADGSLDYMPLKVVTNRMVVQPCYHLKTSNGCELYVSESTPLATDPTRKVADLRIGDEIPTRVNGVDEMATLDYLEFVGYRPVQVICVGGHSYAAGVTPTHLIYTHNNSSVKQ